MRQAIEFFQIEEFKQAIEFFPQEEFRPVNINNKFISDDYLISNYGNVYSNKSDRLLIQSRDKDGYLYIQLSLKDGIQGFRTSRLVLMTFNPILNPEDYQANHKDGNKSDNGIWNLEWVTQLENIHHAVRTGLSNQLGEKHHATKLTNEQVHIICKCLEDGYTYEQICQYMGVPIDEYRKFKDIITKIVDDISWLHISKDYNIVKTRQYKTRYPDNIVHDICKYLEEGKTYRDICKLCDDNTKQFKHFVHSISCKAIFTHISDQYNMIIPKSEKTPLFTDEQIHYICSMLKQNMKSPEILESMNIDINILDSNIKHSITNCISNIKTKKQFVYISNQYF